jgi:uncharacterized glyoxalase superfamily protein PhnB
VLENRSVPDASVIPELAYPDVGAAAAWICEAFGFTERLRIGNHRAQLVFGDGALVVIEGEAGGGHAVLVRVEDVDAHLERAVRAGARVVREPEDYPFGERQYSAEDPGGHLWTFSQSIADVDPAHWGGELR